MGDKVMGVRIMGDKRAPEVEAFRIAFPWGDVEVIRATDGVPDPDYWVHVRVNREGQGHFVPGEDTAGVIRDARLDQTDRHASDANVGDFERPELYHLAVRVGKAA